MSIWKETGAAIDRELERETELERRATLLTMRVKAAEMATAVDGRNKVLLDRWDLRKTAAAVILVGGAVALLGGRKAIWSNLR
ncbi:hypothetical protein [Actinoplanes sp. NPDC020271]|uniref:hypothetical protein n=1 Tax=Actinoplanes sp. NPDC020271 TaxID=3363896 RepID=UPI003799DDBA